MGFSINEYQPKIVFQTAWQPSQATVTEIDYRTGESKHKTEKNIFGRFCLAQVLNIPESNFHGKPVYKDKVYCQIKINVSLNQDIASYGIGPGSLQAKEAARRFPAAWSEFEAYLKARKKALNEGKGDCLADLEEPKQPLQAETLPQEHTGALEEEAQADKTEKEEGNLLPRFFRKGNKK